MTKEFTIEERNIWRNEQPQKMVITKVVIKSDKGNVLLLKSNYKETWQLPGGGVDDRESPETAGVRELYEETGLTINEVNLILKGTIYKQDEEMLFVVYESAELVTEDITIKLSKEESNTYQFINPTDSLPLLSDYYYDFWKQNYL